MKYFFAALILSGALLLSACGGGASPPSKPAVQIIAPPYGASFGQGETVGVQSVSLDANGVTRVELYVDGQLAGAQPAPSAQGEKQFNVVHEWRATAAGAHTLTVRAFNAANVSGEATIPIAVTAPVAVSPTQSIVVTATAPPAEPTIIPTLAPPTPTAPRAEPTTIPTLAPPTPIPPTPIPPTAPLVVFQPPFDGGTNVLVSYVGGQLALQVTAHAGGDDGFGIDRVDFFIQDLSGKVIASKTERRAPFCYFDEANGECLDVRLGEPNFKWSDTAPLAAGWYLIRAVVSTSDGRVRIDEKPVRITIPPDDLATFFVNIDQPTNTEIRRQLDYQASVSGERVNGDTGEGIARVDMFVVDARGDILSHQSEQNPRYCGFGDAGLNTPCNVWNFSQRNRKWPNGAPIGLAHYLVRVIAYAQDGRIAASSQMFQIDGFE